MYLIIVNPINPENPVNPVNPGSDYSGSSGRGFLQIVSTDMPFYRYATPSGSSSTFDE
jgi:hypothetical protein